MPPVEAISVQGGPHNVLAAGMAARAIQFLGLDRTGPSPSTPPTTGSPPVTSPPPNPGGCRVTYESQSWNTGLVANLTVTNTGSATINGWSLAFTLPSGQTITSGWNAVYAPRSGAVTATNMPYNATVGPNQSIGMGFQATHTGNPAEPTAFTLNGCACTVA